MAQLVGLPMTYLIFAGDMAVMAFMVGVVVWVSVRANDAQIDAAAAIPLHDGDPLSADEEGGRTARRGCPPSVESARSGAAR